MRLTILFFSALTIALLAGAPKSSAADKGLSYTTLGATPKDAATPKLINLKTIEPAVPFTQDAPAKNSPMAEVWTKYKELATGQSNNAAPKPMATPSTTRAITKPTKPTIHKPTVASIGGTKASQSALSNAQKKTGLAGIIESFQDSKDTRRKMRSVTVNKPTTN